jgi:diphosphomevalonate decarboxylase
MVSSILCKVRGGMNKFSIVKHILQNKFFTNPRHEGHAFAPINIALVKYWGKRDTELNLPVTASFSVALGSKGAYTRISINDKNQDEIYVNGKLIAAKTDFAIRLQEFLDLFRPGWTEQGFSPTYYKISTYINIPIAAGLASSACGYAALVKALDHLYNWQLTEPELSILARIGSGSACRSIYKGFVEWQVGVNKNGMDSFAVPFPHPWPNLRLGVLVISSKNKPISSREAMQRTVLSSELYKFWPTKVAKDLIKIKKSIIEQDFELFGKTAEMNALMLHATMQNAVPPIIYSQGKTLKARDKVRKLRKSGIPVYFTQDAGPNLKLLFLDSSTEAIRKAFPKIEIIAPFPDPIKEQVILVDKNDKAIGIEEKLTAHQKGLLHRAFSVFIISKKGKTTEILLQQRSNNKYHCPGLWSNTCCSHPRPDEDVISAAQRRLKLEMGFDADLFLVGRFRYTANVGAKNFSPYLIENELDYVLIGMQDHEKISINKQEVQNYQWMELSALKKDLRKNPDKYTPWLKKALRILDNYCIKF